MLLSVNSGGTKDSTEQITNFCNAYERKKMNGALLTTLSMDTNHLTILSMDSSLSTHDHDDMAMDLTLPPDINLPLSAELSPPPPLWNDACDLLDVGLASQHYEAETNINVTKIGKKSAKRLDGVWGAWFFFNFYFKPVLNEKSKNKGSNTNAYNKSDLKLDVFLVQHDMENMYMWAFKDKPENALGKMQLRSYMNGHSRQGEKPFPFSADKGFVRSHRMQRKQYRGLSNPQCIHGIEVVRTPNLVGLDDDERRRWRELTGRDLQFSIPLDASDFGSWRNLPSPDFEIERAMILKNNSGNGNLHPKPKRLLNGEENHEMDLLAVYNNKRKKSFISLSNDDESSDGVLDPHPVDPHWLSEFSGVMKNVCGPVTAAKTIYEDEKGFLIMVSLPCCDLQKVKVTWRNTLSHGIVKIYCVSTGRMPTLKRLNRTFTLTDRGSEHCPPGEFVREISLPKRIPSDAMLEAYGDETGTMLEIMVPKHPEGPEEHEVCVCIRPSLS